MKIVAGSDWRDAMPFETPIPVDDLAPGDAARCAGCPADAPAHERSELWAVKHRHPKNHAGYVRFYCRQHRPEPPAAPAPVAPSVRAKTAAPRRTAAPRESAPRRPAPSLDVVRAMCPNCFVEVSATGECGVCGERVA